MKLAVGKLTALGADMNVLASTPTRWSLVPALVIFTSSPADVFAQSSESSPSPLPEVVVTSKTAQSAGTQSKPIKKSAAPQPAPQAQEATVPGSGSTGESAPSSQSAKGPAQESGAAKPPEADRLTSVSHVTSEQIERAGARNLSDAVALAPGTYMYAGTDGIPSITIRGQRTRDVNILVNGIPFNDSVEGRFDPIAIPVETIDSVRVIRGANSVLYGPGGTAGVIDIVTAPPAAGLHASGSVEAGGPLQKRASATASYGAENTSLTVSATAFERDYFLLSHDFEPTELQPGRRRVNSDREDQALSTTVRHELSDAARFTASLGYRTGSYGRLPATLDSDESIFVRRPRYQRIDDYEALNLHLSGEFEPVPHFSLRPTFFMNGIDELTNSFDDVTFTTQDGSRAYSEDAKSRIVGTGLLARAGDDRASLSAAFETRLESWRATGFEGEEQPSGRIAKVAIDDDNDIRIHSAAVESSLLLIDGIRLVTGAGIASQDRGSSEESDYTYLAGLRFEPGRDTALYATVARKIRFPTLRELFDRDRGNPDLIAETNRHVEIGAEHMFRSLGLKVGASVFHTYSDNPIRRFSSDETINDELYRYRGVELQSEWAISPQLTVGANYSYLDSRDLSSERDTPHLSGRPEHIFYFSSAFWIMPKLRLDTSYRVIAGIKDISTTDPPEILVLDTAHLVDAGLTYAVSPSAEIYARGFNLLDKNYEDNTGSPQPGRSAFAGMRARF